MKEIKTIDADLRNAWIAEMSTLENKAVRGTVIKEDMLSLNYNNYAALRKK